MAPTLGARCSARERWPRRSAHHGHRYAKRSFNLRPRKCWSCTPNGARWCCRSTFPSSEMSLPLELWSSPGLPALVARYPGRRQYCHRVASPYRAGHPSPGLGRGGRLSGSRPGLSPLAAGGHRQPAADDLLRLPPGPSAPKRGPGLAQQPGPRGQTMAQHSAIADAIEAGDADRAAAAAASHVQNTALALGLSSLANPEPAASDPPREDPR